ncbi:hypothetical protein NVP2117O_54 [Vibrio phage 2.117.O._10N.261.45.E9]|nr:hypothetical protein NVP1117O_54 [Vibrio phage 1.117.O._10N.261.45.E9]AUR95455.1 hypothetical protein NVP1207B_48 [Vibrio phage 1.207.B._10N.222.51.C2]AUS02346.1 hypothetical protein NVP2117O_54 [Vibrio phage 2.117.O._10N.261.45.E9]
MSDLLKTLKFVQGAVARKDFVPALTHFRIKDNEIVGYNGKMALGGPIDLDLDVTPKANPLIRAIEACEDIVAMHVTKTGRLGIKSGKFRAYIEMIENAVFPEIRPEGKVYDMDETFYPAVKALAPFVAEDASRPWATGMLFRGSSVFATNNIVLVEQWVKNPFPVDINIPRATIKEILRIKEAPQQVRISEQSITFMYEGGRWLRSQVSSLEWPDLGKVLDQPSHPQSFPKDFFTVVESMRHLTDEFDRMFFKDGHITTSLTEEQGSAYEMNGLPETGVFKNRQLASLEGVAHKIDFSLYPKPCIFYGDKLRGAIIGMRE